MIQYNPLSQPEEKRKRLFGLISLLIFLAAIIVAVYFGLLS